MGKLIVISGPSGSGKSTVCEKILEMCPELVFSISVTTRPNRKKEKDGVHYFFVGKDIFMQYVNKKEFLEWEEIHGELYGTRWKDIEKLRNENHAVLMDIDPKGGLNVKKMYPDSILIFLSVDSIETLIDRLKKRNTEKEIDIEHRTKRAKEEFELSKCYDYIIENDKFDVTLNKVSDVIKKEIFINK